MVRRVRAATDRRRLGRLPARAEADGDRVPRRSGRRRDLPGRDLARVHGEGAAVSEGSAGVVPVHLHSVRISARGRSARRLASARQRTLPLRAEPALFRQAGAGQDRELQAERGRRSGSDRAVATGRPRATRRAAADAVGCLQGRQSRTEGRHRAGSEAEQRASLGVRPRDARRRQADARDRAAADRAARGAGAEEVRAARAEGRDRADGQRPAGARHLPVAAGGCRGGARDARQDRGRGLIGRLRYGEPASP